MKKNQLSIPYTLIDRNDFDSELKELEIQAVAAAQKAYAVYSRFLVGAAVLLDNGEIIAGSNQENAAYPSGTCAERTTLFYAGSLYPESGVRKMVLVAISDGKRVEQISPCGACRQVIMETAVRHHPYPIYMIGEKQAILLDDCRSLLPFGFDGSDLPE